MIKLNKEELKIIKTGLNFSLLELKINCAYCMNKYKIDADNCYSSNCPSKKSKKEIERLKEKIEKLLTN